MKKRWLSLLLCAALCMGVLPMEAFAARPLESDTPLTSNNRLYATYPGANQLPSQCYLYENSSGGLTRVEYEDHLFGWKEDGETLDEASLVHIEEYDSSFNFLSKRIIECELPGWGGFYCGEDYNFLFFCESNLEERDDAEIIRIVKYDKDWNRLDSASLYGSNTVKAFDSGTQRCDEYNGYLFIRTGHTMYSRGGVRHQANMTFSIRISDMEVVDSYHQVGNPDDGYVSHSFNQFLLVDQEGRIVAIDHGDAYPRGVSYMRYRSDASDGIFTDGGYPMVERKVLQTFNGSIGDNGTGAEIGGLEETTTSYIVSYSVDKNYQAFVSPAYNMYPFLHVINKETGADKQVALNVQGAAMPVLVSTGLDGGYMLWNTYKNVDNWYSRTPTDTLNYLTYDADGNVSNVKTVTAPLSGCRPIYYQGKIVWYVTGKVLSETMSTDSAPTFYTLDKNGDVKSYSVVEENPAPPDPVTHTVSVIPQTGGVVSTVPSQVKTGDLVVVLMLANPGYEIAGCIVKDSSGNLVPTTISDGNYTFILPDSDVTVTGVFQPTSQEETLPQPDSSGPLKLGCTAAATSDTIWDKTMVVGQSTDFIIATCDDYDFNAETYTWSISDPSVLKLSTYEGKGPGPLSAIGPGTATITVTDGHGHADSLTVLVKLDDDQRDTESGTEGNTTRRFYDVPTGAYYADAVAWAVEQGITSGTSDTTFSPNATCTRGQAVTFLWRAAGSPTPHINTSQFTDLSESAYYRDAVLWAVEQGITSGTSDTTFSPSATCTRAQIVTFLQRANHGTAMQSDTNFQDVKPNAFYADAVAWAVANGITSGTSDTTFSPDDTCTRAQIVTFMYRNAK